METTSNTWQQLSIPFNEALNNTLQQQHLAVQFIAIAGRYLIPEEKNKSNINLEFLPRERIFVGKKLSKGLRISFHPEKHNLQIRGKELEIVVDISLEGKTFENIFQELNTGLDNLEVDVSSLKIEQPYELSSDSLKEGMFFFKDDMELIKENIRYRQNARLVLHEIISDFEDTEPVRIWPHHFDTGSIINIEKDKFGEATKTIGLGFAIPDKMVPEPYYYLSFWSKNSNSSIELPQNLPAGKWMMSEWDGAVLPVFEILNKKSAEQQFNLIKAYFEAGIKKAIVLLETDQ